MKKTSLASYSWYSLIFFIAGGLIFLLGGCGLFKSEASKELERTPDSLIIGGFG